MNIDIDDLERCAEKAGVWRAAILALVAEVRDLRMQRDEHMIDSEHAYDEGRAAERRDVAVWLAARPNIDGDVAAFAVERGEHRTWSEAVRGLQ